MGISDLLQKKITEALETNQVEQLLENYDMEFTVSPSYQAYANPRLTTNIDTLFQGEVTHLKFTPLVADGYVIIQTAMKEELGAVEFVRGDSRPTGTVSLRAALNGFDLVWPDDRKLKIPVQTETITVGEESRTLLLLRVKRPITAKREKRPRKKSAAKAQPPAPVAIATAAGDTVKPT
jgi:hypothetical protein